MADNLELQDQLSEHANNEFEVRKDKVRQLEAMGVPAWPEFKPVVHQAAQIKNWLGSDPDFAHTQVATLAGRLMSRREHGKTSFAGLQDITGTLQIYLKKELLGEEAFTFFSRYVDVGDIVWVQGRPFITRTGEPTLEVSEIKLLSKCLHPLAEKHHGLTDVEQRYRQRYLDLICNNGTMQKFIQRSAIVDKIREFLKSFRFLEVETPMLHPISGGAAARPFSTHHNAYNMELFLRIAPELYLKRLIVGGMERVFEINRNFRNEGVSTKHNPEFSMLEFYMAYGDYKDGIALTEKMLERVATNLTPSGQIAYGEHTINWQAPFAILTMQEAVMQFGGVSQEDLSSDYIDKLLITHNLTHKIGSSWGEKLLTLFEELAEPKIIQPTFITGFPVQVSPLAKRDANNPDFAARFELYVCGMELANGYSELNDPFDQAERFAQQVKAKHAGDAEAHNYDQDYVTALEYGLPPTVGVGIGIDRLIMLMTDTRSIKDVILFPALKAKEGPTQEK